MSPSAEAFLTLRTECAKSLAVSSLFGYILGLGDRHLDNLLLDQKTGGIVQIDFGICFGMGTSVLHVPELLPFRLTRQMTGMFRPLDGTNLLRHYMIGVLRAIRLVEVELSVWSLFALCSFVMKIVRGAGRMLENKCSATLWRCMSTTLWWTG